MKPIYKILDWIEEENKDVEAPVKYKILFANQSGSKQARIRGVSLQY